ncbi:MAG TPA: L,D-transpeptidase [Chthoniobacterales bacterium]
MPRIWGVIFLVSTVAWGHAQASKSVPVAPRQASPPAFLPPPREAFVSVAEQKLVVMENGKKIAAFPVSTSKFGLGDRHGSWTTPLGVMHVARKIGDRVPSGTVFRRRVPTREILRPNAPGRDPIVTRILWLGGNEPDNRNAYKRFIYIHGTPEERNIGKPASFGCIRMKSADVIAVYEMLPVGSRITVVREKVKKALTMVAMARLQPSKTYAAVTGAKRDE